MKAVVYYLTLPLLYLISVLPFSILYLLSDFIFVILYHILGYRKAVVWNNLKNSFPEKDDKELKRIQYKFFRYLCDLSLESFKTLTISKKTLANRVKFEGEEIFKEYYDKNQSVVIVMGHWGNWELGGARFALLPVHQLFVIYHPLQNKYFEKLVYNMRTRLGNGLYSMKDSLRGIIGNRNNRTATAFIADQTPSPKGAHWMKFLNQDTPIFKGTGKVSTKMNYPVIYIGIEKTGRGRYLMKAEKLVENPKESNEIEIIEKFTQRLEEDIIRIPETWLWSHKRWKHKRPANEM